MNSHFKKYISLSSPTYLILFIFLVVLFFLFVTRSDFFRLKIGDYYFEQKRFDLSANWYTKLIRRQALRVHPDTVGSIYYQEVLFKLKVSLDCQMRETLRNAMQDIGFIGIDDLGTLLSDSKLFLKDIIELDGSNSKERIANAQQELKHFDNILNYYESLSESKPYNEELTVLALVSFFLKGVLHEADQNFLSADATYEKIAPLYGRAANFLNERRRIILPKVADDYFNWNPFFQKGGNANVLIESEDPLIVTGVSPGPDNYLEYANWPIKIVMQKYPVPRFRIQGEVMGGSNTSCIIPRIVFWGPKGYIGETALKYPLEGRFDIYFSFAVTEGTVNVTPRITFDPSGFSKGQRILIRDVKWD